MTQASPEKHPAHTNRLVKEKSPYLLQHAHNPVDWYPWGKEAFAAAKDQDKPIFISIGYATCHWCHVMEHESFESEEIARVMNENFICIKVDREERPDIDNIYMAAVQRMTGQGGWPMSVFLTPEGQPFYGGTYFPPTSRWGRPGFTEVLESLSESWKEDREKVNDVAKKLTEDISSQSLVRPGSQGTLQSLISTGDQFQGAYDSEYGGFSPHTKFPRPHSLQLLMRIWQRENKKSYLEMAENTLTHIADGGIHDHLGGGFARYSVDREWLVPHFEKMLYDQALLSLAYIDAWQITDKKLYRQTVEDIFHYVSRDMTDPEGGFYSAEDADSEGEEGKFYVWSYKEIIDHLGDEIGQKFCSYYSVTESGNFEGHNILNRPHSLEEIAKSFKVSENQLEQELKDARKQLFTLRKKRIHPLKDDKVLTAWNGLMIGALAKGSRAFEEPRYLEMATRAAQFVLTNLQSQGRLLRRWREGEADLLGYVDDYVFMSFGLTELYFATGDTQWLQEALRLTQETLNLFWDKEEGGLYFSGHDGEKLITNFKEIYDGAIPSGNSIAALNFARLGHLTGDIALKDYSQKILETFAGHLEGQGMNYPQMLLALDFLLGPNQEIVLAGDPQDATYQQMLTLINKAWLPRAVILFNNDTDRTIENIAPYTKSQRSLKNKPTVYICSDYSCQLPTTTIETLKEQLNELAK